LFEQDVQGNVEVNEKKLKNLLSVQQQIVSLYSQPVSKFNFYSSTSSVVNVQDKKK